MFSICSGFSILYECELGKDAYYEIGAKYEIGTGQTIHIKY